MKRASPRRRPEADIHEAANDKDKGMTSPQRPTSSSITRTSGPGPFSRVKRPSICPTVFRLNYLIGMS